MIATSLSTRFLGHTMFEYPDYVWLRGKHGPGLVLLVRNGSRYAAL